MNQEKITKIFELLKKQIPNPKTELVFHNPFEFLVSVILSAQATDKSVNLATPKLFAIANTPEKMAKLSEAKLKSYIKTIGLYNAKAKNILKTAKILAEQYHSKIPKDRKLLETLPGVGRKSSNVFLNVIYGEPTIAVDTHVFRVSNRTKIAEGKNPLIVEEKLIHVVPNKFLPDAGHLLLLHGRYVCTAKKPHCPECAINKLCEFPNKTLYN
jgi:endonuclease III